MSYKGKFIKWMKVFLTLIKMNTQFDPTGPLKVTWAGVWACSTETEHQRPAALLVPSVSRFQALLALNQSIFVRVSASHQQLAWGLEQSCAGHSIAMLGVLSLLRHLWWAQTHALCHIEAAQWLEHQHSCYSKTNDWMWHDCNYRRSLMTPRAAVLKPP